MKRHMPISSLTAVCIFALTLTFAIKGNAMNEEQDKILGTITKMGQAYNAGDIDAVMKAYETSAIVMFEPGKPVTGSANVKAMFQGSLAVNPQFIFGKHEVIIAGDLALHLTPWTMTGKTPDGQKITQNGLSVAVLRRQTNGGWLMVIDNPHGQSLLSLQGGAK